MADYYGTLKQFSAAVTKSLSLHGDTNLEIATNRYYLLDIAIKLKNEALFRECLIYVVGMEWRKYEERTTIWKGFDVDLKRIVEGVYCNL